VRQVVKDAYDGLKSLIRRKWGGDSAVSKSVDAIEAKPESKGLAIDLADEVAKAGAAKDGEVLRALAALTGALAKISAEKPPAKSVTISATNVGVGNIATVTGGCFIFNFYGASAPSAPARPTGEIPPCPYKGLAFFGPADAGRFFGRDAAIERLEAAVARHSFTALVGASGSGKSSVVLAGLAPRLHARGGWRVTYFRIGASA
jgi:ABC-type multidrug transport system fused ATPase/permease subunit